MKTLIPTTASTAPPTTWWQEYLNAAWVPTKQTLSQSDRMSQGLRCGPIRASIPFLYALKNEKFRSGSMTQTCFQAAIMRSTEESEDSRARVGTVDGEPVFSTIAEAEAYAEKIGCSGYHTHDLEGETVYMACASHSDATGDDDDGGGGYRKTKSIMERRFLTTNIEARQDDPETQDIPRIEGYATVFNETADLGPFTETGDRAFENVMNDDVRMLFNHHDPNFPLARSKNGQGTLEMRVDEKGVFFSYPVGPQSYAKDLHESIKRGDVDQASFAFTVQADEWEERDGRPHRHITQLGTLTIFPSLHTPRMRPRK